MFARGDGFPNYMLGIFPFALGKISLVILL